jgi:tetratricopeptide (TPR) repeat protein
VAIAVLLFSASGEARQQPAPTSRDLSASIAMRREALMGGSGAFLAAMNAQNNHDMRAAAEFFRDLLDADPRNISVVERTFIAELSDGNFREALKYAERMNVREGGNPLAQAALGINAIAEKKYQTARSFLSRASGGRGRSADLTVALLNAWTHVGSGDLKRALQIVDGFNAPELAAYRNFFGGMMAEVAGDAAEAGKRLEVAYRTEPSTLRVADAYARHISRHGNKEDAIKVYGDWESRSAGVPFVKQQLAELRAGRSLPPLARNVQQGAGEVLYGLGAASNSGREGVETAIIFMQMALFLNPEDDLIKVSVAELYEQMKQWSRSGEAFAKIKSESPFRTRSLLGRVVAYERQERTDDAIRTLTTLIGEAPDELDAVDMLAGLYRTKKKYSESIDVYSNAINRISQPDRNQWNLFFGRGVAYERSKQWPKAEADFLKALELLPKDVKTAREKYERAQVLNYLAYSWVDQRMHIERSFDMLKEAVRLAPDDGAIVDSLGWAYYRLGKYEDAVRELERAIALKPGDPTINDHLGDAYWQIGRKDEAKFKWNHARDLKPEPEELPAILRKIEFGYEGMPQPAPPPEIFAPAGLKPPAAVDQQPALALPDLPPPPPPFGTTGPN